MTMVTSTDAKRHLGSLLDQVQSGDIVEIASFGKPKAVLMSTESYEALKSGKPVQPKRVFGAWKDILGHIDVNALLAAPLEGFEEYMPEDSSADESE
jgi:prevent-host-death family protein